MPSLLVPEKSFLSKATATRMMTEFAGAQICRVVHPKDEHDI